MTERAPEAWAIASKMGLRADLRPIGRVRPACRRHRDTENIVPFGSPKMLPAVVTMGRTSGLTRSFDILPDGRFIGAVPVTDENDANNAASTREMRVVLNWFDELTRLVPVK